VRRSPSRSRLAALASVAALVAVAVFWRAGVGLAAQTAVLALAAAALAAATFADAAPAGGQAAVPPLLAGLGLAVAITALQLVPLPSALVRFLSPGAAELFDTVLAPLGLYPSARPLAVDVLATSRELGAVTAIAAAAAAAVVLGRSERSARMVVRIVGLAGAAAVLVVLGTAGLGAGPLLEPRLPFVNPNHLAAFLALATWPALGFALTRHAGARTLWIIAFALCGLGTFLTLSRAGIAAFFVGAGAFAALLARRTDSRDGAVRSWRHVAVPAAVGLVLVVASSVAMDRVLAELRTVAQAGSDARSTVWSGALEVIGRHPLSGLGRGGFETAFPRFRLDPERNTYSHVENDWLQLVVDLGIPGGLLVAAALLWTWWSAARRRDLSRVEIGALAGLAALGAHAAFDFPSAVPGVAIPAALVAGTLASAPSGVAPPKAWWAAAGVLLALGAVGLGLHASGLARAAPAPRGAPVGEVIERARAAAALSPADFLPHASAGAGLVEAGRCPEAMPWLVRAMWLAPMIAEPHRYAARCLALAAQGEAARREYRLAFLLGDAGALAEGAGFYPSTADLLALAPDTPVGLSAAGALLARLRRHADAAEVFTRAFEEFRDPDDLAGACASLERAGRPEEALRAAARLEELEPHRPRAYVLASGILERTGDVEGALRALERGRERVPGSTEVVRPLAELLMRQRRYSQAILVVDASWQRTLPELVWARLAKVRALRAQQRLPQAIAEARAARDLDPRSEEPHLLLSEVLADAGMYRAALEALQGAAASTRDPARHAQRVEALLRRAAEAKEPPATP
jgi:tetratricopeptide (TPR) repeat protein/O-antigen ligase